MKFTVVSANSPVWANAANSAITLNVCFEGLDFSMPFTASQSDCEAHGRELFNRTVSGEFGSIAAYVAPVIVTPPAPTKEQLLAELQALTAKINALG